MTQPVPCKEDVDQQPLEKSNDEGAALVITIMVMAVLMVLGTTILNISVNNLSSATRSRDAARALDAADAGISQALTHLRANGVRALACSPSCPSNPWGNRDQPMTVTLPGATDQRYRVWIEPRPATDPQFYRVHSQGLAGRGSRNVQIDAELTLLETELPLGVFARSVQGGGAAAMQRESIYTTGCVYNRRKIDITGTDAATGLPAGVHSARLITDSNGNNAHCPSTDNKAIHRLLGCNPAYPFDQDSLGGPLLSSGLCRLRMSIEQYDRFYAPRDYDGDSEPDVNGSFIRDADSLKRLFGIDDDPLSASQLEQLKAIAQQQGTYYTSAGQLTTSKQPRPENPHAVMFFDLAASDPGGVVDLKDILTHRRTSQTPLDPGDPACHDESLLIVIAGGNARFNGNPTLAASLALTSKAPFGEIIKANGNAGLVGTVFADKLNLVGTLDLSLDQCFLANLAPSLYTTSVSNYLEADR